jgi:hypothetical protein
LLGSLLVGDRLSRFAFLLLLFMRDNDEGNHRLRDYQFFFLLKDLNWNRFFLKSISKRANARLSGR